MFHLFRVKAKICCSKPKFKAGPWGKMEGGIKVSDELCSSRRKVARKIFPEKS
jgi:hypothetical protein